VGLSGQAERKKRAYPECKTASRGGKGFLKEREEDSSWDLGYTMSERGTYPCPQITPDKGGTEEKKKRIPRISQGGGISSDGENLAEKKRRPSRSSRKGKKDPLLFQ